MRDAGDARDPTHVVSRALVLSNGALGAEGQCLGLARALGFHDPEVHLVGEAALALAPRFSAAWSEKVPVDGARSGDNARGGTRGRALALAPAPRRWSDAGRRVDPMPRAQSAAAKPCVCSPRLHVRLHALWNAPSARASTRCGSARISRRLPRRFAMLETRTPSVTMPGTPKRLREEKEKTPCVAKKKHRVPTTRRSCSRVAAALSPPPPRCGGDTATPRLWSSRSTRACVFRRSTSSSRPRTTRTQENAIDWSSRRAPASGSTALAPPREAWRDAMATAPAPRLVVAVGGPTRLCRFGMPESFAAELVEASRTRRRRISRRVAASARTPEAVKRAVERAMAEKGLTSSAAGPVPVARTFDPATRTKSLFGLFREYTPYAGAMAWADGILVTADSCSMLSEAVSLSVPVFVSRFKNARGKTARFLAACATRGECVDAATVFASDDKSAAECLASFVRYRYRSVAREEAPSRGVRGDLERVAARVRELVEVRADGHRETDKPSGRRRLKFEEEV